MDASQPKQPHGNFVAFLNRYKQRGDNKPTFDGRLSIPDTDSEHRFALWAHQYADPKTGEARIMFNGQAAAVATTDDPMAQVASLMRPDTAGDVAMLNKMQLQPRQLVLFPNGFKSDAPDKKRPDYWGAFNPGEGQPIVRISLGHARTSPTAPCSQAPPATPAQSERGRATRGAGRPCPARGKRCADEGNAREEEQGE